MRVGSDNLPNHVKEGDRLEISISTASQNLETKRTVNAVLTVNS